MPNTSLNRIVLAGEPSEIDRLLAFAFTDGQLDFQKMLPMPKFDNPCDSIEWGYKNWGTKWNAWGTMLERPAPDCLHFTFETAGNIPQPIFKLWATQFAIELYGCALDECWNYAINYWINNGKYIEQSIKPCLNVVKRVQGQRLFAPLPIGA